MPVSFFPPVTPKSLPDWSRVITTGANVLLEGDRRQTDVAILHLLPHLRTPIYYRRTGDELALLNECTVILRDVDTLRETEQRQLYDWLVRKPDSVQTVSTTESPLFSLVQDGQFELDLYYRLNVILLRLGLASGRQY
jgi:hypothetical protein